LQKLLLPLPSSRGCVKGIEKEGKAEFKVFSREHTLSIGEPTEKPETRPPRTSHSSAKTSTQDQCSRAPEARDLDKRINCNRKTVTSYTGLTSTVYGRHEVECPVGSYPQACLHYSSAIKYANNPKFNPVTCSVDKRDRKFNQEGETLARWSSRHNKVWRSWMRRNQKRCQRDEWPPAEFWQGGDVQYICYNHREYNFGAGSLWSGFCTGRHRGFNPFWSLTDS
jgi:chitinase